MSGRDLRRDERIATSQRVWVEGQDVRVGAEALNMSKGGMFIVTDRAPDSIGSNVEITFDDPHEGRVTLAMEVVWKRADSQHTQLGLRTIDRDRASAFQRVVDRYLEDGAPEEQGSAAAEQAPREAGK
jgi:Tfp pilus assembly protein PilZ